VEFETKNIILFTLGLPEMKYLDVNLTKYVQDLYEENYKTLVKEIRELNKWENNPCSGMRTLNFVKNSVLLNLMNRFSETNQHTSSCFVDIKKLIIKLTRRAKISNTTLKEKNKVGGQILPDIKIYYKIQVVEAPA
jgi:hypothetical protein